MENFIVSARKYRPQTFDTVIGQKSITNTLKNAIKNNQLAQAFLFCGPRGVGKTTCARILAKTINCENPDENSEPCNKCQSCLSFDQSTSFNIHELDAASNNSVDGIRSLVDQVRIPPQGKYKVYIIDEVHMLSQAAFNAFLKTLEEPPVYAKFILATTEKHKILPTILSRCQIFDFKRITIEDIAEHLMEVAKKEGVKADPDALHIIAQKADGALRDALSIFDQLVSSSGKNLTYENIIENLNILDYDYYFKTTDLILQNDISSLLLLFNEINENGFDGQHFITGLAAHLRNILVCKDPATIILLEASQGLKAKYSNQSEKCSPAFIFKALELLTTCDLNYKIANNKKLLVELCLIQIANILTTPLSTETSISEKKNFSPIDKPAASPASTSSSILKTTEKIEESKPKAKFTKEIFSSISGKESKQEVVKVTFVESKNSKDTFNNDELNDAWNSSSEFIFEKSSVLYNALQKFDPILKEDNIVEFIFENSIIMDKFNEFKLDFIGKLRHTLNNYFITIETSVSETEEKVIISPEEKYKKLVSINPEIINLKNTLDLDLSY